MQTSVISRLPCFQADSLENISTTHTKTRLRGTYYLNGPGRFHLQALSYRNWLDGDGLVTAIRFAESCVTATTKFVQGKKFVQENSAGKRIYRTFGTGFEGDKLYRGFGTASPYNVSVFRYQDKLLAFGEQSIPMELEPDTLETKTPGKTFDFGRQINEAMPFSAHPKIDDDGEMLNFGIFFDQKHPQLVYYRFDKFGHLAVRSKHLIPFPCSVHDFAASSNYAIFYLSPHILDSDRLIRDGCTLSDSLEWRPELGSRILVLCRQTGTRLSCVSVPAGYNLHTIIAKETGGLLILDLVEYEKPVYSEYQDLPDLFSGISEGIPKRYVFKTGSWKLERKVSLDVHGTFDFPVYSPSQPDGFWTLGISNWNEVGPKFFDQLTRINWDNTQETWQSPQGLFMGGEPARATTEERLRSASMSNL